jgi:hypothetical protein
VKRLLFLLAIFAAPGYCLTLSEIRTQIRREINDVPGVPSERRYGSSTLNSFINDVQREVNSMTWAVEASSSITLVAGTTYYFMPSNMIAPVRVVFSDSNNVKTTLREDSERSVTENSPDFERNSVGKPTRYFMRQSKSGGTDLEFGIIPVPNSQSTGTIRIDYIVQPDDLSLNSDVPFNDLVHLKPYHHTLVWGVVMRIKMLEGDSVGAQVFATLYDKSVQLMRDNLGKLPNFHPSTSSGGNR